MMMTKNVMYILWIFALVDYFARLHTTIVILLYLGRTLAKFNQLKRNKRFDIFIKLVWVHFMLLPGCILYRKPGGHKIVCTGVKFKSCFNVVKNHTNGFLLLSRFRKSIVWPIYDVPFRSYWRKGQRSNFWLYRGQTGKNAPNLLAMVSKCSSSKYI